MKENDTTPIKPACTLKVEGVRKIYGKKTAVKTMSFTMHQGEIVGLLGPNGAGKTTCFYMIAGFIKATAGKILLDEKDITHEPMYLRSRLESPTCLRSRRYSEN